MISQFYQAEDYFYRAICSTKKINSEAIVYISGLPPPDLNVVHIRGTKALGDTLQKSLDLFQKEDLPFTLVIPEHLCTSDIENRLHQKSYLSKEMTTAMYKDLKTQGKFFLEDGDIRPTDKLLKEWSIPLIAFGGTPQTNAQYAATHEKALQQGARFYHFSLYEHQRPISSITLSIAGSLSRLDDLATLPEFQGRGHANNLMKYAMNEAIRLGATSCYLEASSAGLSLYEKLGFTALFKNKAYTL